MDVIALVGPSGTGKSHHALIVAHKNKADAIIDDGILIKDGKIVEKRALILPGEIRGVIRCHNPRCISSIEQELPHIFYLADEANEIYRCKYCDEKYTDNDADFIC